LFVFQIVEIFSFSSYLLVITFIYCCTFMNIVNYCKRLKSNFNLHEVGFSQIRIYKTFHDSQIIKKKKISGSLGDLGTLLPIMISLAVSGQINLTSTLWFTGIWNILSGFMFQVPVCVQPMKGTCVIFLCEKTKVFRKSISPHVNSYCCCCLDEKNVH
jgi:hypothetical protein